MMFTRNRFAPLPIASLFHRNRGVEIDVTFHGLRERPLPGRGEAGGAHVVACWLHAASELG